MCEVVEVKIVDDLKGKAFALKRALKFKPENLVDHAFIAFTVDLIL